MNQMPSALSVIKGKKSIIVVGNHKESGLTGITEQIPKSSEVKIKDIKPGHLKLDVQKILKGKNVVVVTFENELDNNRFELKAMDRLCKINKYQLFKINLT